MHNLFFSSFSAISVELYYIFATAWGREQYTLYGILFLVFLILLSVTACISIALTYFQLSVEDYKWWWRSIFSAGYVIIKLIITKVVIDFQPLFSIKAASHSLFEFPSIMLSL